MIGGLVWVFEWMVVGLLIGLLAFMVGGIIIAPFVSLERANGMANYYAMIAMKLVGLSAIMERGSKFEFLSGTHQSANNADRFTLGDEAIDITDDTGLRSTMYKQPFGLLPAPNDNRASYVSPELAELGEVETRREEEDKLEDESGEYEEIVELDATRPLVQIRGFAAAMLPGQRRMWDLEETKEIYKESQRLFGETKTTQFMILLIAYGGASLLMWLILTNAGGAVPSTDVSVPGLGMLLPGVWP